MSRIHAHRLIGGAKVTEMLPMGNKPATESQKRGRGGRIIRAFRWINRVAPSTKTHLIFFPLKNLEAENWTFQSISQKKARKSTKISLKNYEFNGESDLKTLQVLMVLLTDAKEPDSKSKKTA